jgi:hypothetical protein
MLSAVLPGAQMVSAAELPAAISKADCTLMVLPYGSAFPEDSWPQILAYLNRGGNLLVLGGRPFTRAAYRDSSGWHLRDYSVRFIRELGIDNYTTVPGSEGLQFQLNSELVARLQPFAWSHAFSVCVRTTQGTCNSQRVWATKEVCRDSRFTARNRRICFPRACGMSWARSTCAFSFVGWLSDWT